jgi:uncharacterized protein
VEVLRLEQLLEAVAEWATQQPSVLGVLLVGSYATGRARPDSDVDLIILAESAQYFRDKEWVREIDWSRAALRLIEWRDEEWGAVWSRRCIFHTGSEVELAFAQTSWATVTPLDPGTLRVVANGFRILYDRDSHRRNLERNLGSRIGYRLSMEGCQAPELGVRLIEKPGV